MKLRKSAVLGFASLLLAVPLAGCGSSHHDNVVQQNQYDFDCDRGDQIQHDSDCGYYSGTHWIQYPWVISGATSYPPAGWEPPAEAHSYFNKKSHTSHKVKTKTSSKTKSSSGSSTTGKSSSSSSSSKTSSSTKGTSTGKSTSSSTSKSTSTSTKTSTGKR